MKKGTKIGNVITDEMKAVIANEGLTSQQVGDILRSVLYPGKFKIEDGMAKIFAQSLVRDYVALTISCAESRHNELERLSNHYNGPKAKMPEWFPSYYDENSKFINNILESLEDIIKCPNNISERITNISLTLDAPPITLRKSNTNTKSKSNSKSNDTDRDTIPPKSPRGLDGESPSESEVPRSMLNDPEAALGLPGEGDAKEDVTSLAEEIESTYRYKVNRGKLRKCLISVLKKNTAAEVRDGYRRWLEMWKADDFQWAPSRITDWMYDRKFLEEPRRGKTRAADRIDPDTVSVQASGLNDVV